MSSKSFFKTLLNEKKNIFHKINSEVGCFGCSNNYQLEKVNLNWNNNSYYDNYFTKFSIDVLDLKVNNNNNWKKKKWLPYHYEILQKCIKIFKKDINKIMIFINEFSEKEINKRIRILEKIKRLEKRKNNLNINELNIFEDSSIDLDKDLIEENHNKKNDNELFSLDKFIHSKNGNFKEDETIETDLNISIHSNFTENFYENKDYNLLYEKNIDYKLDQNIDDNLQDIFNTAPYNYDSNDIFYSFNIFN